jgi:hypothetical protein
MDEPGADSLSEGSVVSELALEQLINVSETTPSGSFIITEAVVANVLHAFTDLAEAIDDLPGDKPPLPPIPPVSNNNHFLRQLHRIHATRHPRPPVSPPVASPPLPPPPPTSATLRGKAITLRPTNDSYKGKR